MTQPHPRKLPARMADRLIVATALEHRRTLVTHDREICRWGGVPGNVLLAFSVDGK